MKKAAVPSMLVVVVLLAVAVIAEAQQPGKGPRIGFLSTRVKPTPTSPICSRMHSAKGCGISVILREKHPCRVSLC